MAAKTKLELTWIGKTYRPRLEPRILVEEETLSHHARERRESDVFDNALIKGDNLLALKALEASHTAQIQCVYIDPPYNTGNDFLNYQDGLEHSQWLGMMRERLSIIHRLLSDTGSVWVSIDDNEAHYLKVMMDEVFGRQNFIASVVWQKTLSVKNTAQHVSVDHEYILVYGKNAESTLIKSLPAGDKQIGQYKNPDNDERGDWQSISFSARNFYSKGQYAIRCPGGRLIDGPPAGSYWRVSEEKFWELDRDGRVWWGKDGNGVPRRKMFLREQGELTKVAQTLWKFEEVGHTQDAKKESLALFGEKPFPTPKPEKLVARIIELSSNAGDYVLDSFAGSGTTGAVAHKMGRRWIMVELGDHCETHIVPRLNKVIDGEDPGGITETVGWKGGGGYRYYKLAPSLLEKDQFDNWVISKAYNAEMLAEAMCKHFGFAYAPSAEHYWMHGHSSETDFIYVTTNSLSHEQLAAISDEVGPERTLLICCKAFQGGNADAFGNLTIRKIPGAILDRCEWGKDDYSLKIEALPLIEDEPEEATAQTPRRKSTVNPNQPGLFNGDEEAGA